MSMPIVTPWAANPTNTLDRLQHTDRHPTMNTTCIHLIRHGEVHNPEQILYGRLPRFRLSARGRAQARSAGDHLREHDLRAVFSSPLLRTRQTAKNPAKV